MEANYILNPTSYNFIIDKHFPDTNKKVGVFLSGGLESTLVSLIAFEKYGKENVICFYSDNIFSNNNEDLNRYINTNLSRAAKLLNITPEYLEFDYEFHVTDRKASVEANIEKVREQYNVDFTLWGFTKLFFEVEPFKQDGLTVDKVVEMAFANPEKFKHTIEEFHLDTREYDSYLLDIDIPAEVYPLLRGESNFILSPFKDLNKCEVIDFYRQLGYLDIAYQTSSCILSSITETGMHCGECFNCQQRYDAFRILNIDGVIDKTPYAKDAIVHRRKKLEELRNATYTRHN
jgi:7-cyano-7-deazaguanine synthase in queuosine biosynthesis